MTDQRTVDQIVADVERGWRGAANYDYPTAVAALAELAARATQAEERHICPVCGGEEWTPDYDYTDEGEMQVDRCDKCQWPPPYPVTVQEWRRRVFFSEYLTDIETALKNAEAEAARLREQLDAAWFEERRGTDAAGNPTVSVWCRRCGVEHQRPEHCLARNGSAEARCAQLEQALERLANWTYYGSLDDTLAAALLRDTRAVAREALAGPDTPADSPILSDKNPSSIVGVPWNKDGYVPADSQPKDTP